MSEHPAAMPGVCEAHPVGLAPRWGVSSLDWRSHAVDEDADHPYGVYIARCGQGLFMGAALYDEPPPGGWMCLSCLRWTGHDVGQCGHPVPGGPDWHAGPCGDCDPSAT
ncbi:MAG: hypothetical protein ACRDRW_13165 [Pseudonocardiaceae bacterium]